MGGNVTDPGTRGWGLPRRFAPRNDNWGSAAGSLVIMRSRRPAWNPLRLDEPERMIRWNVQRERVQP